MSRDQRRMTHLTWVEYAERVHDAVLLLPLGAVEQHGPHLPLDTDTAIPEALCLGVAALVSGIVAPSFAYGYKSQPTTGGGELFPGTTSFDGATFTACVRDLVRQLSRKGAQRLALVNGNYENMYFALEGVDLALRDSPEQMRPTVLVINWWEQLTAPDLDEVFEGTFPGWEAEHAGIVETSLMLHFAPERVLVERIPPPARMPLPTYTRLPEPPGGVPRSGILASAEGASAEIGGKLADKLVTAIERAITREFSLDKS